MNETKKSKPIGKIILAILLAVVVGIGVYGTVLGVKEAVKNKRLEDAVNKDTTASIKLNKKTKEFATKKFSITVTEDFEKFEDPAIEVGCISEGIEIYAIGDEFDPETGSDKMTAAEYLENLAAGSEGNVKTDEYEGVPFAEYVYRGENDSNIKNYKVFCYKGTDCFWMVHFITVSDYTAMYKPYIFEWVKTIEAK